MENRPIRLPRILKGSFCALLFVPLVLGAQNFHWDWRRSEELTYKQSLRRAEVTSTERAAIARAIANQLRQQLGLESEQELPDIALETRVKMVDLNGDGVPEVIAQGGERADCSPTGNCPFWVFQKSDHEYKLLFATNMVQTFTIEEKRSNGFRDIVVASHGSATQSGIRILRYSEGKYYQADCYSADWSVLEGDTVRELKEPRLTPCANYK